MRGATSCGATLVVVVSLDEEVPCAPVTTNINLVAVEAKGWWWWTICPAGRGPPAVAVAIHLLEMGAPKVLLARFVCCTPAWILILMISSIISFQCTSNLNYITSQAILSTRNANVDRITQS